METFECDVCGETRPVSARGFLGYKLKKTDTETYRVTYCFDRDKCRETADKASIQGKRIK